MKRKLYIDCTVTAALGENTGVQRVVRNIVKYARIHGHDFDFIVQPVFFCDGHFYPASELIIQNVKKTKERIVPFLKQLYAPVKKILPLKIQQSIRDANMHRVQRISTTGLHPIEWGKEDILFMADALWFYDIKTALEEAFQAGVSIGILPHDLFPITNPEVCDENLVANYTRFMEMTLPFLQFSISNSNVTKNEFASYARACGFPNIRHESFILGAELDGRQETQMSDRLIPIFNGVETFLVVGTIEPRKNHSYILDAFEILWNQNVNVHLLILGKVGWKCEVLMRRIKRHPLLNKRLFVITDADDSELYTAYVNTEAVLACSRLEGFNLVIVEALRYGKHLIASDIPVHREVGGKYPHYVNLESPTSLADAIKTKRYAQEKIPEDFTWPTWEESTRQLLGKIQILTRGKED